MKSFCEWLLENNLEKAYRYEHDDGSGLMNNSSLNYDKLTDDEYNDVEEGYLGLQQPSSLLHTQKIIFAFTNQGEQKHKRLIELLIKASKKGVVRKELNLSDYIIVWDDGGDQLGLKNKGEM